LDPQNERTVAHTINGTALAVPRILLCILETYQTKEGGVEMPEVLKPYLPFDRIEPVEKQKRNIILHSEK
jgi:seryl-tRNA synthetase